MKSSLHLLMLLSFINLFAQDQETTVEGSQLRILGSVDAYFRTNLTGPNDVMDLDGEEYFLNPGTSFADRPGFSFGMANVVLSYEGKKAGFVADIVVGPRGEDAVFLSVGSSNFVNQLFVYWNVSESIKLTLGNFNTFLGYEVISPTSNFNYSTSYMFSNGPFSHTGLKADFTLSDNLTLMLAVMNSTDFTEVNFDGSYTFGAQIGFKNQFLNIIYGEQTGTTGTTFQIDYTGGIDLSDSFFLGINSTFNDTDGDGFYGAALYPQYSLSESLAIGIRGEYFGVQSNNASDESVFAATLSANYKIDDLTIIPELRIDNWSNDVYVNNDMNPTNILASFLIGTVYSF